ncbi:TetR/AcrR family transcriptional regulator [Rhodovulum sp. 12E13]|uniref:TetR/AcrR family transcriptional regulator n=1 Tax=Rhodovulum sp. 12E13 TaxID=2203891 RepID=UPI00131500BB|nr:TetR family transcriptional regulator [Rhodovulum sp. 12E13]
MRLLAVRPERIVGETAPAFPAAARAPVTLASLLGFAEALVLAGTEARGHEVTAFDVKTVSLSPRPANRLTGEAIPQPAPAGLSVWTVTIQDDHESAIATLVLTYALRTADGPPEPAPAAEAPPRMTHAEDARPETPLARILAAATDVIARKGFAQATMREIADATGMHVPTLYAHVKGKDELLELVYAHEMERLVSRLEQVATGASATERIRRMMEAALDVADERRRQIGILNRELKSLRPEARARMIARYRALVGRYEAVIRDGIASGEFHDIDPLVAANFLDMIHDIWALRQFFLSEMPRDAYLEAAVTFALKGLVRA